MGGCIAKEQMDFDGPVDFTHFEILRAIGKGAFGKVCIVKKRDTKEMYALKYMNKVQIIEKRAVDNVFREIHILKALDHPFIVNLWFAFQDEEDIFLVLDLMLGGDISYHLEKEGRFSVARVRLYMAEVCLALDYLADSNIIHRDIKPANMLLDSKGHIHLTDFNVASVQKPGKAVTSMTGTKPYMAPEVIRASRRGYSVAVDWWSLGVSAYEMLRGERPYTIHHNMSNDEVYRVLTRVRPPASARWEESTCNVLKMLLHPEADKRLATLQAAKGHAFFKDIDWEQVYRLDVKPDYVPPQNRIHCDPTHELEEMIVEPNPLHKKKSRLSKRRHNEVSLVRDDLDKINDKFIVYNRLTDSILRVDDEGGSHVFSDTAAITSSPFSSMDAHSEVTNMRDTSLSLRRESLTIHENHTHKNGPDTSPAHQDSEVTSPVQVVVENYENKEEQRSESGSSVAVVVVSSTVKDPPEGEGQSINSVPEREGTPDILSSGTPSNIYNPKDSDSIIPTHLLGSYNGSVDGEIGIVMEGGGVSNREGGGVSSREGGGVTSREGGRVSEGSLVVISESDVKMVTTPSPEGVNNSLTNELNGCIDQVSGKSTGNTIPDDLDTNKLLSH